MVPVVGRACTFADGGQWVVPTTRGLWVPAGIRHRVRMVGEVQLRTLYIRPDASPGLPRECCVVAVSSLLRELILAATDIDRPYSPESRNGHLMGLLFEEMAASPSLPLRLPQPS
ncbi:MAG: AraC family transcriptional regulator, partial [Novosphingobium sp.]